MCSSRVSLRRVREMMKWREVRASGFELPASVLSFLATVGVEFLAKANDELVGSLPRFWLGVELAVTGAAPGGDGLPDLQIREPQVAWTC